MEENSKKAADRLDDAYTTMILSYLAAFLIGLGVISLIAANWQHLQNIAKLGGILLILALNAGGIIWSVYKQKNLLKQVLCCLYAFLIMGAIGLIGQIYHVRPDVLGAALLWCGISWPLLLVAPRLLWLWIPVFFGTGHALSFLLEDFSLFNVQSSSAAFMEKYPPVYTAINWLSSWGIILAYCGTMIWRPQTDKSIIKPLRVYSALILLYFYSFGVTIAPMFDEPDVKNKGWMAVENIGIPLLFAVFLFVLNRMKKRFSFMPLFLIGIVIEMFLPEYIPVLRSYIEQSLPIIYILVMLAYASYHKMPRLRSGCVAVAIIWFIASFTDNLLDLVPGLIICAFFAVHAYLNNIPKLFNTAILLIVLRILTYYADVDDLTYMGIYLIVSGLILIVTVLGLRRYGKLLWENKDV